MPVPARWPLVGCLLGLTLAGCQPSAPPPTKAPPAAPAGSAAPATADADADSSSPQPSEPADQTSASESPAPAPTTTDTPAAESAAAMNVTESSFGKTPSDQDVTLYTLSNGRGLTVKVINWGATIISVETLDRANKSANITLGFPSLEGYTQRHPYFGSAVGRYCNRIAGGKFKLDDQEYTLATNNGPNHLHGGKVGFDARLWKGESQLGNDAVSVKFTLVSPDGDEGYPGQLTATVTYSVTANNELKMEYTATTDKPTIVNLTNHCYWNLSGAGSGTILKHQLEIAADKYLPVDETSIPTGELADVKDTPFDFTSPHAIGQRIEQLAGEPGGYDHCYALRNQDGKLAFAARVTDPDSGRSMEILTTEPGIQFYTGNYLAGMPGENNYPKHAALCLETQHYPDAPNRPNFATTRLDPGQTYKSTTIHKFSVAK